MPRPPSSLHCLAVCVIAAALLLAGKSAASEEAYKHDYSPAYGHASYSAKLSMLPAAPQNPPQPWRPFAIEKAMGAQWCPQDLGNDQIPNERASSGGLLHQPCLGLLPQHLALVLLAIPVDQIFVPTSQRISLLQEEQGYLAIPGRGTRPDFLATVDFLEGITVRSFEGSSPADTVYLVYGPFRCIDSDPNAAREGEYRLDVAACNTAQADSRLYKWTSSGVLADITGDYLPAPQLTAVERSTIQLEFLQLDMSRLSQVPVMRWTSLLRSTSTDVDHDYYQPAVMPTEVLANRRFGDELHFGFVVWDGRFFQTEQRVPRSLWPMPNCNRLRPDKACDESTASISRHLDPFVDEKKPGSESISEK